MTKTSSIYWLNKDSRTFLSRDYLKPGVTPEERMREIAETAERILGIKGFADRFESYLHKGCYSLSTPVWTNFGAKRGLAISCNGSYVADSMHEILGKVAEVGMMSKYGAGTSAYFGDLRARGTPINSGGKASGPIHYLRLFDSVTDVVSQSSVRRGSFAAYLPVEHPDIEEFLNIKENGDPIQDISIGVCITDEWMKSLLAGDKAKRAIWKKIVAKKFSSGYPYLFFTDTANRAAPQVYKDKGMKIHASNLCNEIALSSSPSESFVCNLSSLNVLHYDAWKDTDAVETLTYFLDAVMTDYIDMVKDIPFMKPAHTFAVNQRALGIGVLGWHSLLQSKSIAFESMEAKLLNTQIFRTIRDKSHAASRELAVQFGEPPLLKGYGMRNVTTMAVAPTKSSSFILGQVSQGIEPIHDNYYTENLAKGKFTRKNVYLEQLLESKGKNDQATWNDILKHGGSVQHLDFLSEHERNVFKTFGEISQKEIVIQAAARQKFIDQGQSVNLMVNPKKTPEAEKEVSKLMIFAWEQGVKGLYYQKGANPSQELSRSILNCSSCEA